MICKYPRVTTKTIFPCRFCLPCLLSQRRVWCTRLLLEGAVHGYHNCSFVTLTYNDAHLPSDGVSKDAARDWTKRVRTSYEKPLKFFTIGEYGDQFGRAHYHSIIFGMPPHHAEHLVQKAWTEPYTDVPLGHTHVGDLSKDSAFYVAGYVQKKAKNSGGGYNGLEFNKGKNREFALNRAKPGIGFSGLGFIEDFYKSELGINFLNYHGDVGYSVRFDQRSLPLGSGVRGKLRERLQFPKTSKTGTSPIWSSFKDKRQEALRKLFQEVKERTPKGVRLDTFQVEGLLEGLMAQTVANIEARFKLTDYRRLE